MEATVSPIEHTVQVQPEKVVEKKKIPLAAEVMEGITLAVILILFSWTYVSIASTLVQ